MYLEKSHLIFISYNLRLGSFRGTPASMYWLQSPDFGSVKVKVAPKVPRLPVAPYVPAIPSDSVTDETFHVFCIIFESYHTPSQYLSYIFQPDLCDSASAPR